ncbi:MAG TPA: hypothetical protein VEI97_16425, partial [bacterium]|nr:hypothetical protein [bacterium]
MTARFFAFLGALSLAVTLAACQGTNAPKQGAPAEQPAAGQDAPRQPAAAPGGSDGVHQEGEPNPTGTPEGEAPRAQPVDRAQATQSVADSVDMSTDKQQARAFIAFYRMQPDAPRWVITWQGGAGQLDWDKASGVLTRRLPDGTESK